MSSMESKMVIRVEIPSLRGKGYDEAYNYYKSVFGEPEDVDVNDGEVTYFHYEKNGKDLIPVKEYSYGNTADDRWGVDYILYLDNEYGHNEGKMGYPMEELLAIIENITNLLGVSLKDCNIISYSWYNGADEPIEFECKKGAS